MAELAVEHPKPMVYDVETIQNKVVKINSYFKC